MVLQESLYNVALSVVAVVRSISSYLEILVINIAVYLTLKTNGNVDGTHYGF
jgi:hypothetical protein